MPNTISATLAMREAYNKNASFIYFIQGVALTLSHETILVFIFPNGYGFGGGLFCRGHPPTRLAKAKALKLRRNGAASGP